MKKQNKIQLTLLLTGLMLFILTYIYYPNLNKNKFLKNKTVQEDGEVSLDSKRDSSFENVKYKGFYNLDKLFTVEAEKAYILSEEADVVYMNNMRVILHLNDGRIVNITSTKGRYNKTTYDCFFENSVRATDGETEIFSENLDLLATENSVEIYNNVVLNYTTGSLRADKIDYNFETKYFKVSMFDDKTIKMKVIK
jgi:hypothetical protein